VLLSGMSAMRHVEENLVSAEHSAPGILTAEELAIMDQVRETYRELRPVPCTSCRYCLPCPNAVNISRIFELYNDANTYDDIRRGRFLYHGPFGLKPEERADNCVECKECEEVCPQEIPITEWLVKAHALLGPENEA
jgi:predicted aldo/keto reductase-like oxidoreductase